MVKCELCGGKADFYGHIQFIDRPHVYYFCERCLDHIDDYGVAAAISIYCKVDWRYRLRSLIAKMRLLRWKIKFKIHNWKIERMRRRINEARKNKRVDKKSFRK